MSNTIGVLARILPVTLGLLAPASAMATVDGPYTAVSGGGNWTRTQFTGAGRTEFDAGPMSAVNLGYLVSPGFRPEIEFTLRDNETDDDFSNASGQRSVDAASVLMNMWIDLPRIVGALYPYFGVGGGTASLEQVFGAGDESDTVLAYQAGAGLAYDFNPLLAVSVGWRYFATETPSYGMADAARYRADGAMATLRFSFGRRADRWIAENLGGEPPATGLAGGPSGRPAPSGPAGEVAAFETVVFRDVNFQFDKSELTQPGRETLDELAARLSRHPDVQVTVVGHTDSIGSNEYNMALSERRALAVRDYLSALGVNARAIDIRSMGENAPEAANDTKDGRATNRRAEFQVVEKPGDVKIVIEGPTQESIEAAKPGDPIPE